MKKIIFSILVLIILSASTAFSETEGIKTITLKDGTILKGNIIAFQNNVYTIKTALLGEISVRDEYIISIAKNPTCALPARVQSPQMPGLPQLPQGMYNSPQMQSHVNQLTTTLMSDPSFITEIQQIVDDPELMNFFSDPSKFNLLFSLPPEEMQKDETFQKLIQNPKMQKLMEKVRGQLLLPSE